MPERFNQASTSFVMPEILNQASMFLLFLWFSNTVDPGLKIAGVTNKGMIEPFRGDEQKVIEVFRNDS